MSWSIKLIGSRKAVFDTLHGAGYSTVPIGIKNAIGEILASGAKNDDGTDNPADWVNAPGAHDSASVEGCGHGGNDNWSGITSLKVELFTAAQSPVPVVTPDPTLAK